MLTVKHTEDGSGRESVVSVERAVFAPLENCLIGLGPNAVEIFRWTSGRAYVMNEHGKTVAVYNITMKLGMKAVQKEEVVKALGAVKR